MCVCMYVCINKIYVYICVSVRPYPHNVECRLCRCMYVCTKLSDVSPARTGCISAPAALWRSIRRRGVGERLKLAKYRCFGVFRDVVMAVDTTDAVAVGAVAEALVVCGFYCYLGCS